MERHSRGRLSLGGATWGGLLGIPLGALVGSVYGAIVGNAACGLDGALLGGLAGTAAGAIWGVILGFGDAAAARPRAAHLAHHPDAHAAEEVAAPPHGTEVRSFHLR